MHDVHPSVRFAIGLAVAIVLGSFGAPAKAAPIAMYTNEAMFLAATTRAERDTYDDLKPFVETPAASTALSRTVAGYGYVASSVQFVTDPIPLLDCFFPGTDPANASDIWLGTNFQPDYVTIDGFTGGVSAIGGYFFATDFDYAPTNTRLRFTITRGDQTFETVELAPGPTGFLGFVGRDIVSLRVDNLEPGDYAASPFDGTFLAINDLILAQAVPEPEIVALLAIGVLAGAFGRHRRRSMR